MLLFKNVFAKLDVSEVLSVLIYLKSNQHNDNKKDK